MTDITITEFLREGWDIAGYSTTIMSLGAMIHSVLLRKGTDLRTITILAQHGDESNRVMTKLR